MKIVDVFGAVGVASHFRYDFAAIANGAEPDGFSYRGRPQTPGFDAIVEPAGILSVLLRLEDGSIAFGDCLDVCFAGSAGRDAPFAPRDHMAFVDGPLRARLVGRSATAFPALLREVAEPALHTAVDFGLSQALLHAAAIGQRQTVTETVAAAYGVTPASTPVAISASCELDDLKQLDRMILKRLDLIPHVYVTDLARQLGPNGDSFADYLRYVVRRVRELAGDGYRPRLHIDMSGALGRFFDGDAARITDYMARLADAAAPHDLLIETPMIETTRADQIDAFRDLRHRLAQRGTAIELMADEWCNTLADIKAFADAGAADAVHIKMPDLGGVDRSIEAVLHCRSAGVGACLGGSANETDQSARISAQIALACRPDFMMSKPGLGGDEGYAILTNEMSRTLATLRRRWQAG